MSKKPFVTKEKLEEIIKEYPTPFYLYDEKGIRSFDFFGVSEDQEHHGGINGFKQSFDPELVEYIGEFDMPISKFWFEVFHTWAPKAVSLKNKLLVRRKK